MAMGTDARLNVILGWHMHQPDYRDHLTGEHVLPWTYLHAIKDYSDMASHLAAVPEARAVFNFAPVLLDQIEDYRRQIDAYSRGRTPIRDRLLASLAAPRLDPSLEARRELIAASMRAHEQRMIQRFAPYRELYDIARRVQDVAYLSEQFACDLVVWYHLAWLGETIRRRDVRVRRLMEKAHGFSSEDRHELLRLLGDVLRNLVPQYRKLAADGQAELSMSPYAHPILPLLLDFTVARETMPHASLPAAAYPDGEERARWQLDEGIRAFERHFGLAPRGCWPSEGALSDASLELLDEAGFEWTASGEGVLRHSLPAAGPRHDPHPWSRPYQPSGRSIWCWFRHDRLSDTIGFDYATWHADDAVANFVHQLERIRGSLEEPARHVVPIIMDGENAWEYYPENAYYFLSALYSRLVESPVLRLVTMSECRRAGLEALCLPRLVTGSWVYGTLSTWIGSPPKNRGWDLLTEARAAVRQVERDGRISRYRLEKARHQLAVCEGSDWFWWLGEERSPQSIESFDALFRRHLANLYELIDEPAPQHLTVPLYAPQGEVSAAGAMRRATL